MPGVIANALAHQPFVVLDGALATELERRGAKLQDPLWSAKYLIEEPQLIKAVHRDYFDAGADVATTATYQASFEAFARRGLDSAAAARLMCDAVTLAVEARDEFWAVGTNRRARCRPLVAASVGPYGAMLADGSEYRGHYAVDDAQLRAFHSPRLAVLAGTAADLLACETIPCLREAIVIAQLLAEMRAPPAWISFACRDPQHNCAGEDVSRCAAALHACPQVAAVGVNCTDPEFVAAILRRMASATDKPLIAYPNSGESYDPIAKSWSDAKHHTALSDRADEWLTAGARLIGGCCRTTPADIGRLRARSFER